ncbi:MAG: RNA signal recognition particle [Zetaproteobacteria bacterium CG2_30_46_52]|nr:MAG: RNA signal recognition particle [Zetaproteobacteria bacterium CG2_30_46_52]
MSYVDGFVAAVPESNKDKFIAHAKIMAAVFKDYGALRVVDTWGDDVPEGEVTSFPLAVQKKDGEVIVFSWVIWPSKEVRNAGWQSSMEDPRMNADTNPMPFDGKRLIYGGFDMVSDV